MKVVCARALALLIVLAFAIPAYAQSNSIAGTVIDRDGKRMSGATVVIERKEVGFRAEVKTNKDGIYIKTGVDDGTYRVTVVQGGVPVSSGDVVAALGFRVERDFDLRADDRQQQAQNSAPVAISKAQKDAEQKANTDTQGAFNAGLNALKDKNYDEAVKQFKLAAERRPNAPVIYNRLGETYMEAKKYSEAAEAWKKATELKSDDADYFYNLGMASVRAGKFDDAKAAIQKAVDIEPPRGGVAFFNLGMLLAQAGQTRDAIDAMNRSIKQNPKTGETYYQLGLLYMNSPATMPDAAAQFEKYLQVEPKGQNAATAKELLAAAKASGPGK